MVGAARRLVALAALTAVAGLSLGCVSGATSASMKVPADRMPPQPAQVPLAASLRVGTVTGGEPTNPLLHANIGNADFETALEESLGAAGLLAPANTTPRFLLDAELLEVDIPAIGFSFEAQMTARYTLRDPPSGRPLWQESIGSSHTTKSAEAFSGATRARMAQEGAARANLASLIERLYLLDPERLRDDG